MFEISNNKIVGIFLSVLLALIFLSNISLAENSNRFASFNGNAEFFSFNGENTEVSFKSTGAYIYSNFIIFNSVKNITIQEYNGTLTFFDNIYSIQVYYKENNSQYLKNVNIKSFLYNSNLLKTLTNKIILDGYENYIVVKPNYEEIMSIYDSDYIILNGVKRTNFSSIFFKIDNTSSVEYFSGNIKLEAYSTSDLKVTSQFSNITMYQSTGVFGLKDHNFDVKITDILFVEILPKYQDKSFLKIDNNKVTFFGYTNSAKLNDEDIILIDIFYWFKEQPEKIMAIAAAFSAIFTAVLLFLTALNYDSTRKLLSMERGKKKHEKQRFLNILLAELETNSLLLENLKKSVQNFNKLKKNDPVDFLFLGFKKDGFNAFRNQGGFEYITPELYNLFIEYYNILNKISKKLDISDSDRKDLVKNYIKEGESMKDIGDIEIRTNNLKIKLNDEMKDS